VCIFLVHLASLEYQLCILCHFTTVFQLPFMNTHSSFSTMLSVSFIALTWIPTLHLYHVISILHCLLMNIHPTFSTMLSASFIVLTWIPTLHSLPCYQRPSLPSREYPPYILYHVISILHCPHVNIHPSFSTMLSASFSALTWIVALHSQPFYQQWESTGSLLMACWNIKGHVVPKKCSWDDYHHPYVLNQH